MKIRRGDILYAELGTSRRGSIQTGIRPVVVVSNNKANQFSTVFTIVPLTTKIFKKRNLPTHVFVSANTCIGLEQNSVALCEQVSSLIDEEIIEIHGHVDKYTMNLITEAVKVQIGAYDKFNI